MIPILCSLIAMTSATLLNINQINTMVDVHNFYRASVSPPAKNMQAMQWAYPVATTANTWASKCIWGHSGTPNVGENLYVTSVRTPIAGNFNPTPPVNSWGNEKQFYFFSNNTCVPGHVCGHYTQIIWANSINMGCAFQDCATIQNLPWPNGGTMIVCQYTPPGNYYGQRPYVPA